MILKTSVKKGLLKIRNLSEEKTHRELKYSVIFVTKMGTKNNIDQA